MTREEAKKLLEEGECIHYHVWTFTKTYMTCCEDGCCEIDFSDVEETLDQIAYLSSNKWEDVHTI